MSEEMKISKNKLVLVVMIVCIQSFLYFADEAFEILKLQPSDVGLLVFFTFALIKSLRTKKKIINIEYNLDLYIVLFFALILTSSIQSNLVFGQSIIDGLIQQRRLIIWCLIYFLIKKALESGNIRYSTLFEALKIVAFLELFLFILQYLIAPSFMFLHVNTSTRYGGLRFYFMPTLLDFLFMVEVDKLLDKKRSHQKRLLSAVTCLLVIFETMVVQKFRLTSIALLICLALAMYIKRSGIDTKIVYTFLGVVLFVLLLNTTMAQDLIYQIKSGFSDYGHFGVRLDGRKLYLSMIAQHPILGAGYPYIQKALEAAGYNKAIFLSDNGVFGYIYIYGTLGAMWVIMIWRKLIKMSVNIFKQTNETYFLFFYLFFIITSVNEIHWYWETGFGIFILSVLLLEEKNQLIKMEKENNVR